MRIRDSLSRLTHRDSPLPLRKLSTNNIRDFLRIVRPFCNQESLMRGQRTCQSPGRGEREVFHVDPDCFLISICPPRAERDKLTWCFGCRYFCILARTENAPNNLRARVELRQRRNRMDHLPEHHPGAQSNEGEVDRIITNEIPRRLLSNHLRRTVRGCLPCQSITQPHA